MNVNVVEKISTVLQPTGSGSIHSVVNFARLIVSTFSLVFCDTKGYSYVLVHFRKKKTQMSSYWARF